MGRYNIVSIFFFKLFMGNLISLRTNMDLLVIGLDRYGLLKIIMGPLRIIKGCFAIITGSLKVIVIFSGLISIVKGRFRIV